MFHPPSILPVQNVTRAARTSPHGYDARPEGDVAFDLEAPAADEARLLARQAMRLVISQRCGSRRYSRPTCSVLTLEMHRTDNSCMPFDRCAASSHQISSRAPGADLRGAAAAQLRRLFWLGRLPAVAWVRLCQAPGEILAVGARAVPFSAGRAPIHSQQAEGGADVIYLDHFRKDTGIRRQR